MRFFRLFRLVIVAALLPSLFLHPGSARAEDEQGTPTADEAETTPPRENPSFLSGEAETPAPAPKPAPTASDNEEVPEHTHVGIGKFSQLPFHLSLSVMGGYDDNVITNTTQGKPSLFLNPNLELTYKFGDPRTTLSLRTTGGISYYFDRPGDQAYDLNAGLGLAISHKFSARLTLSGVVYLSYQTEPDFSANVGTNRRSGNFFYSSDRIIADYQWLPRFSTATSYTLVTVNYDNSTVGIFQDRTEHTFGNEFRFLLWPHTTVLADLRFQIVSYNSAPLDSTTELLLGGLEHVFNPRFSISLRAGAQFRSFKTGRDESDPYFEGTLNYAAGRHTVVSWTNRYSFEQPGVPGAQSRKTFRTGLQAKYGFTQRISSSLGFYFVHDNYAAVPPGVINFFGVPAFAEDSIDATLSVRYEINRTFSLDVGFGHTEVTSQFAEREYSRNRYFGGVNFTF